MQQGTLTRSLQEYGRLLRLPTKQDLKEVETALKHDIAEVKHDINLIEERTKGRFTLLQWMIGFNLALTAAVLAKLFI